MVDVPSPHVPSDHGVEGDRVLNGHSVEHLASEVCPAALGVHIDEGGGENDEFLRSSVRAPSLEGLSVNGAPKGKGGGVGWEVGAGGEEGDEGDVVGVDACRKHVSKGACSVGQAAASGLAGDGSGP